MSRNENTMIKNIRQTNTNTQLNTEDNTPSTHYLRNYVTYYIGTIHIVNTLQICVFYYYLIIIKYLKYVL